MNTARKAIYQVELKQDGDAEGLVSAVFCTFDAKDRDGDVVLRSGFRDGQNVKMHWSHERSNWIGDGTIRTTAKEAVFDGKFWLDTIDGAEAYKKVRHASEKGLAEWSWSFSIPPGASKYGQKDGEQVRFLGLSPLEIYEVSPVAVAAGRDTRTLALKSGPELPILRDRASELRLELLLARSRRVY